MGLNSQQTFFFCFGAVIKKTVNQCAPKTEVKVREKMIKTITEKSSGWPSGWDILIH